MCVILLWPSKIICSMILMQNMFNVWVVGDKLIQKCVFGRSGLNTSIFEKHFISYSCIIFIKYYALRSFCIKLLCFFKILVFPNFWSIECDFRSIENLEKNTIFWKIEHFYCIHFLKHNVLWKECMSMRWNVFQKHLDSTQIFQKHIFESICPQQLKH